MSLDTRKSSDVLFGHDTSPGAAPGSVSQLQGRGAEGEARPLGGARLVAATQPRHGALGRPALQAAHARRWLLPGALVCGAGARRQHLKQLFHDVRRFAIKF